jgi:hypothetical protein
MLTFGVAISNEVWSQQDSLSFRSPKKVLPKPAAAEADMVRLDSMAVADTLLKPKWNRPTKALMLGLIVPGGGQLYNKKYWKLPILYAGIGAAAYFWISNQSGHSEFKKKYALEYELLEANPAHNIAYYSDRTDYFYSSINQLSSERDNFRRYRDLAVAGSIAFYVLSLLDAYVDAHLSNFDLSPNLSVSVNPLLYRQNNANFTAGISVGLNFKNNRLRHSQLYSSDFN